MIDLPVLDGNADREPDGERFWRSYDQLREDPDLVSDSSEEFLPGASHGPGTASRRQFLQLMGASMAMAGLTACRRPVEKILPYARQPEEVVPGLPLSYATAMPLRGSLRPILVRSNEGRPTKVEGNPEHPMSLGATSVFEQASVLGLYDPDRSKEVLRSGDEVAWSELADELRRLAQEGAARIAVLAEPGMSPTVAALRGQLESRYNDVRWITYRGEGDDNEGFGLQTAFGRPVRPLYRLSRAQTIVSLDHDFLGATDPNHVYNSREFAEGRKLSSANDELSRLYVIESQFSVTGGSADNRLRLRASDIPSFAAALADELGVASGTSPIISERARTYAREIARDLRAAGPRGVVTAGETQPPAVHALCASINSTLGSIGEVMMLLDTGEDPSSPQSIQMQDLVSEMRAGNVDVLLMIGTNPVYSLSPELGFVDALANVPTTIHLGHHVDETARAAGWHVPRSHYLEAWGDGRAYDGTASIIQPLIAPLYDATKSEVELLGLLATGEETTGYDLVRQTWRGRIGGSFEQGWRRIVHDGFDQASAFSVTTATPSFSSDEFPASGTEDIEVVFRLDPTVLDGSYANNAWMQELPDPTTKLVWDNVALMSRATAEALGANVRYDRGTYVVDRVSITTSSGSVELPVWIMPGMPDNSVTVNLGYGREISSPRELRGPHVFDLDHKTDVYNRGPIANEIGHNVAVLRSARMGAVVTGAQVERIGGTYELVTTQEQGSMEGRPILRKGTLEEYRENPTFAVEMEPTLPGGEQWSEYPELWSGRHPQEDPRQRESRYYDNQWGMVIDLNACTGCNACVVACYSENNIPVVGKEEVGNGRHMGWLRLDRYFVSSDELSEDEPEMLMQPMLCQHCENAPCESVCPVAATYRSPDGLNQMVYNRCIGTRYCSNNCPYKVRRFNFYNWTKTMPETVQMGQNPNVTVRMRGVMEKCTFCVQRIRGGQRTASMENRHLEDGEVMTACQQACPSRAISFGDLNDPQSEVVELKKNSRRYEVLSYLNTKPRLSYLGRVNNPNPRLAELDA